MAGRTRFPMGYAMGFAMRWITDWNSAGWRRAGIAHMAGRHRRRRGDGEGDKMKRDCCPSTGDLSLSLSALPVTTTHPITPS